MVTTSTAFTDWMLLWGGERGTTKFAAVTKVREKGVEQQMSGLQMQEGVF